MIVYQKVPFFYVIQIIKCHPLFFWFCQLMAPVVAVVKPRSLARRSDRNQRRLDAGEQRGFGLGLQQGRREDGPKK